MPSDSITKRICNVPGCGKIHLSRGWCRSHYRQQYHLAQSKGEKLAPLPPKGPCKQPGCKKAVNSLGLCRRHYYQIPEVAQKYRDRAALYKAQTYGFVPGLAEHLKIAQQNRCDICRVELRASGAYGWCRDHCHKQRTPRGLLCRTCNSMLGYYEQLQRPLGFRIEAYETYLANPPVQRYPYKGAV